MSIVADERLLNLWLSEHRRRFVALADASPLLQHLRRLDMPKKKQSTMKRIMGKKHLPGAAPRSPKVPKLKRTRTAKK